MSVNHFYDPHPGHLGAAIPLPASMLAAVRAADGLVDDLDNVIAKLRLVADALVGDGRFVRAEVSDRDGYIQLVLVEGEGGYPRHSFRLIRYEAAPATGEGAGGGGP